MKKKIDRERAIYNLGVEAQRQLLKSEVMRFRLEEPTFKRLLMTAGRLKKMPSTLVREWVVEKLNQVEEQGTESPESLAISIIADSLAKRGLLKDAQVEKIKLLLNGHS